jgi:hypothetical protein
MSDDLFGFWRRFLEDLDRNGMTLVYSIVTREGRQVPIDLTEDPEAFRQFIALVNEWHFMKLPGSNKRKALVRHDFTAAIDGTPADRVSSESPEGVRSARRQGTGQNGPWTPPGIANSPGHCGPQRAG